MKTINNNKLFKITLLILTFSLFVLPLFAKETKFDEVKTSKRFISDVEKITGKLSDEEKAIARFSFRNSFTSLGYNWIGNLDIDKALAYVPAAVNLEIDTITNYQLPGESKRCNDLWFFIADEAKINTLLKDLGIKE